MTIERERITDMSINSRYDEDEESTRECGECGQIVDADEPCCEVEDEDEDERRYYLSVRYDLDDHGRVSDFQVVDHGLAHPDYFQGCGIYGSAYEECVTGAGDTAREALEDAVESMAQNSVNVSDDTWDAMLAEIR
jgi:hypothetical protein